MIINSNIQAYARSGEVRSRFGSRGLMAIANHFSSEPFKSASDRTGIIDYANWAMQHDGPGLYKYPTPANTDSTDPDYQVCCDFIPVHQTLGLPLNQDPDGIFESRYFVDVMKWFVKIIQSSVGNYGDPRGAIALTATAVSTRPILPCCTAADTTLIIQIERGFTAFIEDGSQKVSPRFASEHFSTQCDDYYELAGGLSPNGWRRIMATYGLATPATAFKAHTRKTSLSTNRRKLYIRSSSPIVG